MNTPRVPRTPREPRTPGETGRDIGEEIPDGDGPPERGYIVSASERLRGGRLELDYIGRMESGETFAVVETRLAPFFYIRQEDYNHACAILESGSAVRDAEEENGPFMPSTRLTMDGAPTVLLRTRTPVKARELRDSLHRSGVRTYEADVKLTAQHLMDLRVRGTVEIRGPWQRGRRVARIYRNPELSPSSYIPKLSILCLDLETDKKADAIYAAALVFRSGDGGQASEEVLLAGAEASNASSQGGRKAPEPCGGLSSGARQTPRWMAEGARCFPTEKEMLLELRSRVLSLDPDVLTGWNVEDFDFRVLARRFAALGLPFDIGRSDSTARFLEREGGAGARWKRSKAIVEGRQVVDGMWLTRLSGLQMEDFRLETVARTLLGKGKRIEYLPGESGVQAVERLYRTDPDALAAYCLEDTRLAMEILEKEGLMELAVAKSLMIGASLEQTWASVASFEHLYMEHMHARGFVAPTLGIDQAPLERSPGGGIITPRAGLYRNVLVFDFKSLYPSIIRTFNIDPLTHLPRAKDGKPCITAPNGERFGREPGILPEILDSFFESRARARIEGNRAAAYAYKIVMNSFYGVLGTDGCRFASSALASTITTLGQHILFRTRDRVKAWGRDVIYGDTDSLFVISGLHDDTAPEALDKLGESLCAEVNGELAGYVEKEFGVQSRLELEYEGTYRRFFLPPMRTAAFDGTEEPLGRAKGYAGLRVNAGDGKPAETLDIVGMEAVRHDWTELAQELQRDLLDLVFHDVPAADVRERVRALIGQVRAGKKDGKLVYRKLLRKPVEAYTKSSPPHARAAAMLPREERTGIIRYVWTREGPQPESKATAPPDYEHYVEKQIRPIVESLAPYIGLSTDNLFSAGGQMGLF